MSEQDAAQYLASKLFGKPRQQVDEPADTEVDDTTFNTGQSIVRALHPPPEPEPEPEAEPEPKQQAGGLDEETMAVYREWYEAQQPKPQLTQEESLLKQLREAEESGNATASSMLANDLKRLRQAQGIFGDQAGSDAAPPIVVPKYGHPQGPEPTGEPPPPEFDPAVYSQQRKEGRKSGEADG